MAKFDKLIQTSIVTDLKWPSDLIRKRTQSMVDMTGRTIVRGIRENILRRITVYGRIRKLSLSGTTRGTSPSLAASTERKKQSLGVARVSTPLYRFGTLYRAIHYYKTGQNKGRVSIKRVGKYGSGLTARDIARIQQTPDARTGRPARRFFGITENVRVLILNQWTRWLRRAARRTETSYKSSLRSTANVLETKSKDIVSGWS